MSSEDTLGDRNGNILLPAEFAHESVSVAEGLFRILSVRRVMRRQSLYGNANNALDIARSAPAKSCQFVRIRVRTCKEELFCKYFMQSLTVKDKIDVSRC